MEDAAAGRLNADAASMCKLRGNRRGIRIFISRIGLSLPSLLPHRPLHHPFEPGFGEIDPYLLFCADRTGGLLDLKKRIQEPAQTNRSHHLRRKGGNPLKVQEVSRAVGADA